jgi:pimeloyl-ACP methyl ester carboxylesterase
VSATPEALETPAARFGALPGFAWPATPWRSAATRGLHMAVIDEGTRPAPVFLCLHGNPSWSYLYRKMIPVFLAAGGRVVAPDLIGFGRSDKPVDEAVHTFDFHRAALAALVEDLDLNGVTLVVQDWGGLLGLTLPMLAPQRYTRLLVMNTAFPTGEVTEGFRAWRAFSNSRPDFEPGALFRRSEPTLSDAECAAYDAPFPDRHFKAALRAFPNLVPDGADAPGAATGRAARDWFRTAWRGASFMAVGTKDPVLGLPVMQELRTHVPGCPEPLLVPEGGHFVQEHGDRIAAAALAHWARG